MLPIAFKVLSWVLRGNGTPLYRAHAMLEQLGYLRIAACQSQFARNSRFGHIHRSHSGAAGDAR